MTYTYFLCDDGGEVVTKFSEITQVTCERIKIN